MRRIAYVLLVALAFICLAASAEEIRLKDGTKVNGKIIAVNGDTFQVKTAYGEIQVPRDQIVAISFPENAPAAAAPEALPVIDESLDGTTYTNRTAKFQAVFPKGWTISPELRAQSKDITAALMSPDQTLFFLVTPEKFAGPLNTFQLLVETQYQSKFKDYEKLSQSDSQIDGKKAVRFIWHGKNHDANDAELKSIVYVIPYEGRIVRLAFLTLEPLFNDAAPVFDKIAASYHSIGPEK